MSTTGYETIPQPPAYPIIGHLSYLRPPHPVQNMKALAREHGPIYRLHLPEQNLVVISSMENGPVVYICGEARSMAPGERQAFADIFRAKTATSEALAQAWLDDLVASKRYLTDVWAAS
jgi:hypothetical protein